MKKFFILVAIVATSILSKELVSQPVTPGDAPCPCSALHPGYFYTGQYFPTKPVLFSNMTLDEFVGYVIMDSVITYGATEYPTSQAQENFIKGLTCTGDTLRYAMRYLYNMADANPFLYYNFLTSYQKGKLSPMTIHSKLMDQIKKQCGPATQELIKAEYILHLRVNQVVKNPTTDLTYVLSEVLDTIKGRVLPDMNGAFEIFHNDSVYSEETEHRSRPINPPANTNFIYYYNGGLSTCQVEKQVVGNEYIAFTFLQGACVNTTTGYQYYVARPTAVNVWGGVLSIVDGNVLDKKNIFGWGKSVPLQVFKTNLQTLIDSIKNYDGQ